MELQVGDIVMFIPGDALEYSWRHIYTLGYVFQTPSQHTIQVRWFHYKSYQSRDDYHIMYPHQISLHYPRGAI